MVGSAVNGIFTDCILDVHFLKSFSTCTGPVVPKKSSFDKKSQSYTTNSNVPDSFFFFTVAFQIGFSVFFFVFVLKTTCLLLSKIFYLWWILIINPLK